MAIIAQILPPFTQEPPLVGEMIEILGPEIRPEMIAKLRGKSDYVLDFTDGYVVVRPQDIKILRVD